MAQRPPDAGRVLEDSRRGGPAPAPRRDTVPALDAPERPAIKGDAALKVLVKGFRLSGSSAFPQADLLALLSAYVGRELDLAGLQAAADVITHYYRTHGYFVARAYLPAQDISDGIVEITILEGRIGSLKIEVPPGSRIRAATVEGIAAAAQAGGTVIEQGAIERSLLLIQDLPGVNVQAALSPGSEVGTSDLRISATDQPLFSGAVDVDNYGNRFSGENRLGATLYLNNPSGYGDLASLRVTTSGLTDTARIGYLIAVGANGLKLGGSYNAVRYELGSDFEPLGAYGDAQDASLLAQYPLVRSRALDVNLTGLFAARHFFDATVVGTTSDRKTRSFNLGLSGDLRDGWGGGGLNYYAVSATGGELDLGGWAPSQLVDSLTRKSDGNYSKLNYFVSRLQALTATTTAYFSFSGQAASKNLDSSEQFTLGGPTAVRAYPTGEAVGDEGWLLNAELRWDFMPNWQLSGFIDHGRIQLHHSTWTGWQFGNADLPNAYSLSGAGVGLTYSRPGDLSVRMVVADAIGSNPGHGITGNNADNRPSRLRGWLQLVKTF